MHFDPALETSNESNAVVVAVTVVIGALVAIYNYAGSLAAVAKENTIA